MSKKKYKEYSQGYQHLSPKNNQKVFSKKNNDFDSNIHVMIPHSSGKGFVQKLKTEIVK